MLKKLAKKVRKKSLQVPTGKGWPQGISRLLDGEGYMHHTSCPACFLQGLLRCPGSISTVTKSSLVLGSLLDW